MSGKIVVFLALLFVADPLMFGTSARAVVGIPDDVPAATVLFPFFKVTPTPTTTSRQDTLIVVTNTANTDAIAHVTIWNAQSEHIFDFSIELTPHDVYSCSLLDLLVNPAGIEAPCKTFQAPSGAIEQLTVDTLLAGYVTVDVVTESTALFPGQAGYPFANWNILIGHLYLVDLPAGSASGFNAVGIESANAYLAAPGAVALTVLDATAQGKPASALSLAQLGFYLNRCLEEQGGGATTPCLPNPAGSYGNRERIDGPSGDALDTLQPSGPFATQDSPLNLLVRYFSLDAVTGASEVWLWKDRNTEGAAANVTVAVYDEDENTHSITLPFPNEVNFVHTTSIVTPGVAGGWFRIKFTCGALSSCGYSSTDPTGAGVGLVPWVSDDDALQTPIQAVAYAVHSARAQAASLRWDAIFPAHRHYTNYVGGIGSE